MEQGEGSVSGGARARKFFLVFDCSWFFNYRFDPTAARFGRASAGDGQCFWTSTAIHFRRAETRPFIPTGQNLAPPVAEAAMVRYRVEPPARIAARGFY